MKNYFAHLGFEAFSDRVADKVIDLSSDKIADKVVEKIKPILTHNVNATENTNVDTLLPRRKTAQLLKVSGLNQLCGDCTTKGN